MSLARRVWLLFVLSACVTTVMTSIISFFPAAVPIARDTGATSTELTWIVDAFTLTMAAVLLPAGAIGDRFGRRGVMNLGMGLFVVIAGVALFADSPNELIAVRAAEGFAAGLIMPSTLSLITTVFPPERRQQAVTVWAAVMMVSGTVGMMGGAALLEFYSWHSIQWMIFVVAVATFALGWTIPTTKERIPPRLDGSGALLGALVCGAAVFGLIEGGNKGWTHPSVLGGLGVAAVAAVAFVAVELRVRDPLLDVRVFRIRPFSAGAVTLGISFSMLYGNFYLGLLYFQYVEDLSTLKATVFSGFAVSCGAIPMTLLSVWLGHRLTLRTALVAGLAISTVAMLLMAVDGLYRSEYSVAALFTVLAAGVGLNAGPASNAIVENVPDNKQGVASAVNHVTRDLGIAFAIALFGSLQASAYKDEIGPATEGLPAPAADASRDSVAAALAAADQAGPAGAGLATAARDAFASGMQFANLLVGIGLLVCTVGVAVLTPGRDRMRVTAAGLSGMVRTVAGAPVEAAGVAITDGAGRQVGRAVTDANGRFSVPVLEPGEHVVVCFAAGMSPAVARISANGAGCHQELTLQPG